MPRREARPPQDFVIDLTADWCPYAAIPEGSHASDGWALYGTVRKRGQTFGFAWRRGMTAACIMRDKYLRCRHWNVAAFHAVTFDKVPGWEGVPKSTGDHYFGNGTPFFD